MSLFAACCSHNGLTTSEAVPAVQISDRKHLYLIDDDNSVRTALSRGLEHLGYDVQPFCHRPAYWSHFEIGILEPVDDRRNGAKA
jgi:hypothetical protein